LIKESMKSNIPIAVFSILIFMAIIVMFLSLISLLFSFFPDLLLFLF